jgi:hypothetical protein
VILELWQFLRTHVFYWVLIVVAFIGFRSWLAEHDSRLLADQAVKTAQTTIDQLHQQIATGRTDSQKQVQVVVKEVQAAKTPAQQIAEIPRLVDQPLNPQVLPDAPSAIKVDLQPLLAQLSECKQDSLKLGACQQEIEYRDQIEVQQGKQVIALKQKPSFWHRVGDTAKKVAIGAGVGIVTVVLVRGRI